MAQKEIQGSDWLQSLNDNFDELYTAGAAGTASATVKGPVELATNAEALTGTDALRALTAAALAYVLGMVDVISFAGAAAAGACTMTGVKVGDVVLAVTGVAAGTVGNQSAKFQTTITVADQIQQSDAGNLSANIYTALILRKS
jgi:hypothetical protein